MRCPSCACECAADASSCHGCGGRLGLVCGRCGTGLRAGARFCDACGEPVAAAAPRPEPRAYTPRHLVEKILTSRSAIVGERKQVTVLFADVKGSMDLAEEIDPEAWHSVMDGFFTILADGIHRYEGTVNQYTGDGIMALFGAPIAHEDHAQRACHAALHLGEALRRYADELRRTRGLSFTVRMGLNSGEVVVGAIGDDLRMDYTAQGHTVGLAARVEQLAEPGTAYLTQHTAALVEGYFRLRDLGPFALKGVRQPVGVFALEGLGTMRTRLDVSRARGFSRFVGREEETALLEAALAEAAGGRGQVVAVVAEPGVGKSRLGWEFIERCRARGLPVHHAQAVPHGKSVPFLVALELVRGFFGVTLRDDAPAARKKIAGTLVLVDAALREALPLVCEFLGVGDPSAADPLAPRLAPEVGLRRLLAIVTRVVQAQSRSDPTVVLVEDLQWMDGGSETFLHGLLTAVPGSRMLLLVNFRPGYRWTHPAPHRELALEPLRTAATSALLAELLGDHPTLAGLAARIGEHTKGNPFFMEELVRALEESGTLAGTRGAYRLAGPAGVTIPASVQAVLAARIDRLGEREKGVLYTAAVIGKEVPGPILERVAALPPLELQAALQALVAAEFLYEVPGEGYSFAHPLTQEVAYRTQLAEGRGQVHAAVARAIAALDAGRLDERAALLAHHWAGAGDALEAARWHRRAAAWVGASDFREALHHWREARRLLETQPGTDETNALRVDVTGGILTCGARVGLDDAERATLVAELQALSARIADPGMRITALAGPAASRMMAGDPEGAIPPLREAAELAARGSERGTALAVQAMLVLALFVAGRLPEALETVERTLADAPADVALGAHMFGFSPYLMALTFRGVIRRIMGRLADAADDLDRAGALARAHGQLEMLGYVEQGQAFLAYVRGDADAALTHARTALELAERIDSPFSRTQAFEALGVAHLLGGRWAEAREVYERALAIMRESGTGFTDEAFYLAGLARTHLGAGDLAAARARAEEAVATGERRQTRFAACEASLVLGEVLAAHDQPEAWAAAERALANALAGAAGSGAATTPPFIHLQLAEVARRRGDAAAVRRELATAEREFTAMGAPIRAAAAARALAG